MSDVLIYTVGSRLTGLGHVKRCLTLAAELKKRGVGAVFATEHETPGVSIIRDAGFAVYDYHPFDFSWTKMGGMYRNLIVDVMGDPSEMLLDAARPAFEKIIVLSAAGYAPHGV
jgi:hypothetical protein